MKALRNITLGVVGVVAGYYLLNFVWIMFWDVLMKIIAMLQTAFMVAIVMAAIYVLWKILSYRPTSDRD